MTESTLSLLGIRGDIELDSIVAADIPFFTQHLTLSGVYAGRKGDFSFYGRGPESSEIPEFTLKFGKSIASAISLVPYMQISADIIIEFP